MYNAGKEVKILSGEYGINESVIHRWIREYTKNIDNGDGEKYSLDDIKQLKKENANLKLKNKILKKATAIFAKMK